MRNKIIMLMKVLLILIFSVNLTGCWGHYEIEKLGLVMGVGIDKAKEPDNVELTLQVAKINESKSKGKNRKDDKGSENFYINAHKTGRSILHTIRQFTHDYSRRLFFQHNYIIVFGEYEARNGIKKDIDFFMRDHSTRMNVWIIVSKGKASEVLKIPPQLENIPAVRLNSIIINEKLASESAGITLLNFVQSLESESTAPLATMVEIKNAGEKKIVSVVGMAVFRGDKFVGELSKSESRGYLWAKGQTRNGIIKVNSESGSASLEMKSAKGEIKSQVKDDSKVSAEVKIKQLITLDEMSGFENMEMEEIKNQIEQKAAEIITDQVAQAFKKSKELNADFFGIGNQISKSNFVKWKTIEDKWEEIYPKIEVSINVEVTLLSSGNFSKF